MQARLDDWVITLMSQRRHNVEGLRGLPPRPRSGMFQERDISPEWLLKSEAHSKLFFPDLRDLEGLQLGATYASTISPFVFPPSSFAASYTACKRSDPDPYRLLLRVLRKQAAWGKEGSPARIEYAASRELTHSTPSRQPPPRWGRSLHGTSWCSLTMTASWPTSRTTWGRMRKPRTSTFEGPTRGSLPGGPPASPR